MKEPEPRCIGWEEREGECDNPPDLKLNASGLWCTECERARRQHISDQMDRISRGFAS